MSDPKRKGFAAEIVKEIAPPDKPAGESAKEEVSDSEYAAKEFLDAVKSGDAKAVARAFKNLATCGDDEEGEQEEFPGETDKSDADKPNPESD